jgi:PhnO protein
MYPESAGCTLPPQEQPPPRRTLSEQVTEDEERATMAITIRDAGPGDEPAVVDLIQELATTTDYPTTIDEHYVRHYLASPESGILMAFDDGAPVGLVSYATVPGLFHAADSGLIEAVVVTEGRRGEGIGRQLVRSVLARLEKAGCAEISVSTGAENEAAQKVYVDLGLTEASVLLEKHIER